MLKIKRWYINLLDKEKKNIFEKAFYCFLFLLSSVYRTVIFFRNFLYNAGIARAFKSDSKVISIGNISWAGSGKTTLAIYLFKKLSPCRRVAVLRRGYGEDEGRLFADKNIEVLTGVDRAKLAKDFASRFDVFILDDGLQHRRLSRDISIVTMAARELEGKIRLIPAGIFRESLSSLKRADILLLSYANTMKNRDSVKEMLAKRFPHLKVYCANYRADKFLDLDGKEHEVDFLRKKKVAVLSAIGYPKGFLITLQQTGIAPVQTFIFPDHYTLSGEEFNLIEDRLLSGGIEDLVITYKDKYHLPQDIKPRVNVYILDIALDIDDEPSFINEIEKAVLKNN